MAIYQYGDLRFAAEMQRARRSGPVGGACDSPEFGRKWFGSEMGRTILNPQQITFDTQGSGMQVQLESPNQPEIIALIGELDAYQDTLYPAEARYALDLTTLEAENVLFMVARANDGAAIACGAVVLDGDSGELKRMFVRPANRAQGAASRVWAELELESVKRGCRVVRLETGPYQPDALAFYTKHGFQTCPAFGDYPEHPLSVFMQKWLGEAASTRSLSASQTA